MVKRYSIAQRRLARSIGCALLCTCFFLSGSSTSSGNLCLASPQQGGNQDVPPTTFTVTGLVRNQSNQPVSGVRLSVTDENNVTVYSGFVESNGRFTVRGMRQGRFTLRIETTGSAYEEYAQAMELQSLRQFGGNEIIPVDVILKVKRGGEPSARAGSVFVQEVPKAARTEYDRATKDLKGN
ncbi:MAG: carboxypeptidase-like regulatory domain-containing protein, partial [Acidobacteriota bacterium]